MISLLKINIEDQAFTFVKKKKIRLDSKRTQESKLSFGESSWMTFYQNGCWTDARARRSLGFI